MITKFTRRELLGLFSSAALLGADNLSYPLATLDSAITPAGRFFVRNHYAPPDVSLRTWRVRVEGRVENPYELSYSDLIESPSTTLEAVLECAGNVANGSAASNGVWEGTPFAALLARARPQGDAKFVLLEGADAGSLFGAGPALPYAQKVPLEKCLDRASLVAFKLNGRALPARNGFPARALFPGWYGMDSVKWLRRITVLGANDPAPSFEQSGLARVYNRVTASGEIARLSSVQVKSAVAWPSNSFKLPAARYTVWGFAWSGGASIRNVNVSVDGGRTWQAANLEKQPNRYAWVKWNYAWNARPGDYVLIGRASDENGRQQPLRRDPARKDSYELNWCVPLAGSVR